MIELPLAPFFLSKLLGRSDLDVHYLESLDPVLYKNLLSLRQSQAGDIDDLGLDFTIANRDFDETQVT